MWKRLGGVLSAMLIMVMMPAMLIQAAGELLIYGLGYLPRRCFNRKAKLDESINAWLGLLYLGCGVLLLLALWA